MKRQPWDQQEGEPAQSYAYFVMYRDMLGRSIAKLAKVVGQASERPMMRASSKYRWVERAQAWDREIAERSIRSQASDIAEMRKRHAQLGVGMQTAAAKDLRAYVRKIEQAAEDAREKAIREGRDPEKAWHEPILAPKELVWLAEFGTNLERLARGEAVPGVPADSGNDADLQKLSTEELKLMRHLRAKMAGKPLPGGEVPPELRDDDGPTE